MQLSHLITNFCFVFGPPHVRYCVTVQIDVSCDDAMEVEEHLKLRIPQLPRPVQLKPCCLFPVATLSAVASCHLGVPCLDCQKNWMIVQKFTLFQLLPQSSLSPPPPQTCVAFLGLGLCPHFIYQIKSVPNWTRISFFMASIPLLYHWVFNKGLWL